MENEGEVSGFLAMAPAAWYLDFIYFILNSMVFRTSLLNKHHWPTSVLHGVLPRSYGVLRWSPVNTIGLDLPGTSQPIGHEFLMVRGLT